MNVEAIGPWDRGLAHMLVRGSPSFAAIEAFATKAKQLGRPIDSIRGQFGSDGEPCYGLTLLCWRDADLTPILVGTVLRQMNQTLLVMVDRTGSTPLVTERVFG